MKLSMNRGEDFGCPTNKEFRTGRYTGYYSLGPRSSSTDSWEFDASAGDEEQVEINRSDKMSVSISGDGDANCNGEFVSFWRHNDLDDDGSSSASHEEKVTFRFLSNIWRYSLPNDRINNGDNRRRRVRGFFHHTQKDRLVQNVSGSFETGKSDHVIKNRHDDYLLLASSSTDCVPQGEKQAQHTHRVETNVIKHEKVPCKGKRSDNILILPMIRPLFQGSVRGYTDSQNQNESPDNLEDDVACDVSEINENSDLPMRHDHAAVIQSISQGIIGIKDDALLSVANCKNSIPLQNERFHARFNKRFNRIGNQSLITQLHRLLQKEDWSLATVLLQSNRGLAQTWHHIDRLFDGRYGSVVLPIHAACALRPPPSFIIMLATLYPEGLLEKEKGFERVPLHVACRGVAESGVIRVLCEMEPKSVDEQDTYKRVPLHYLIKNYFSFGDDDDDINMNDEVINDHGINAMKMLLKTNPNCVHAADHRGWLPIHVACSSSSRRGMIPVIKLLLTTWPESIHVKTDKGNDALACVAMAGTHHPTKDRVIALLQEASILDCTLGR